MLAPLTEMSYTKLQSLAREVFAEEKKKLQDELAGTLYSILFDETPKNSEAVICVHVRFIPRGGTVPVKRLLISKVASDAKQATIEAIILQALRNSVFQSLG